MPTEYAVAAGVAAVLLLLLVVLFAPSGLENTWWDAGAAFSEKAGIDRMLVHFMPRGEGFMILKAGGALVYNDRFTYSFNTLMGTMRLTWAPDAAPPPLIPEVVGVRVSGGRMVWGGEMVYAELFKDSQMSWETKIALDETPSGATS
jgi:hypothetical protein